MSKKTNQNVKHCPTCGQPVALSGEEVAKVLNNLPPRSLMRAKLLLAILPFSEATLWRKSGNGSFPKPVKISDGVTGWRAEEVRQWMSDKGLL